MGFLSWLRGPSGDPALMPYDTYDPAQRVLPDPYEPYYGTIGGIPVADPGVPLHQGQREAIEALWRSQPNVRKVVDFIARNVASIPLHTHERVSDTDRARVHDHPLSDVVSRPRPGVSAFRFWHSVISDGLLYDRWAVLKQPREDGGLDLVQVPSWRLRLQVDALKRVTAAWYWVGDGPSQPADREGWRPLDLGSLILDYGYAPSTAGVTPLETLADLLAESAEAVRYRRQVWRNGARVPAVIERPASAPQWSAPARERFREGFRNAYTGEGAQAGGVPLLEDGMTLNKVDAFSPEDTQDLEGRKLTAIECAAAWHIAPELVGARQGNYSNVREYRQMLYRDSLGPYITAWEGAINAQLVPDLAEGRRLYVEANVEAKLRGSFEEQAKSLQASVGGPWMSRAEARARMNLPRLDGTEELIVPLNVVEGGQASPQDSTPDDREV